MTAQSVKWWSLVHKWTSLVCTLFLLMLCITGLPLIFHDEIDELFKSEASARELPGGYSAGSAKPAGRRRQGALSAALPPGARLGRRSRQRRQRIPLGYARSSPGQRFLKLSFDSRTAELIGEDTQQGGLMSAIRIFHRDMFLGLPGELFLGVMGLLFVIAIVSGIMLYAPFMRRLNFGTVRRIGASRVKWLDLHNLIGGVTLIWLLAVGVTGVINTISLPLFSAWRAEVMPELIAPHLGKPPLAKWADVDDVMAAARRGARRQYAGQHHLSDGRTVWDTTALHRLDQGHDADHLAPVHARDARRRNRAARHRAWLAVVSQGVAGIAPASFRGLRQPAAEDHLGAVRSCRHRRACQRRLSLARQAQIASRHHARAGRAACRSDIRDPSMKRERHTMDEIFRWPLLLGGSSLSGWRRRCSATMAGTRCPGQHWQFRWPCSAGRHRAGRIFQDHRPDTGALCRAGPIRLIATVNGDDT